MRESLGQLCQDGGISGRASEGSPSGSVVPARGRSTACQDKSHPEAAEHNDLRFCKDFVTRCDECYSGFQRRVGGRASILRPHRKTKVSREEGCVSSNGEDVAAAAPATSDSAAQSAPRVDGIPANVGATDAPASTTAHSGGTHPVTPACDGFSAATLCGSSAAGPPPAAGGGDHTSGGSMLGVIDKHVARDDRALGSALISDAASVPDPMSALAGGFPPGRGRSGGSGTSALGRSGKSTMSRKNSPRSGGAHQQDRVQDVGSQAQDNRECGQGPSPKRPRISQEGQEVAAPPTTAVVPPADVILEAMKEKMDTAAGGNAELVEDAKIFVGAERVEAKEDGMDTVAGGNAEPVEDAKFFAGASTVQDLLVRRPKTYTVLELYRYHLILRDSWQGKEPSSVSLEDARVEFNTLQHADQEQFRMLAMISEIKASTQPQRAPAATSPCSLPPSPRGAATEEPTGPAATDEIVVWVEPPPAAAEMASEAEVTIPSGPTVAAAKQGPPPRSQAAAARDGSRPMKGDATWAPGALAADEAFDGTAQAVSTTTSSRCEAQLNAAEQPCTIPACDECGCQPYVEPHLCPGRVPQGWFYQRCDVCFCVIPRRPDAKGKATKWIQHMAHCRAKFPGCYAAGTFIQTEAAVWERNWDPLALQILPAELSPAALRYGSGDAGRRIGLRAPRTTKGRRGVQPAAATDTAPPPRPLPQTLLQKQVQQVLPPKQATDTVPMPQPLPQPLLQKEVKQEQQEQEELAKLAAILTAAAKCPSSPSTASSQIVQPALPRLEPTAPAPPGAASEVVDLLDSDDESDAQDPAPDPEPLAVSTPPPKSSADPIPSHAVSGPALGFGSPADELPDRLAYGACETPLRAGRKRRLEIAFKQEGELQPLALPELKSLELPQSLQPMSPMQDLAKLCRCDGSCGVGHLPDDCLVAGSCVDRARAQVKGMCRRCYSAGGSALRGSASMGTPRLPTPGAHGANGGWSDEALYQRCFASPTPGACASRPGRPKLERRNATVPPDSGASFTSTTSRRNAAKVPANRAPAKTALPRVGRGRARVKLPQGCMDIYKHRGELRRHRPPYGENGLCVFAARVRCVQEPIRVSAEEVLTSAGFAGDPIAVLVGLKPPSEDLNESTTPRYTALRSGRSVSGRVETRVSGRWLVWETCNGEVVGAAVVRRQRGFHEETNEETGGCTLEYIAADRRRGGRGYLLVAACEEVTRSTGLNELFSAADLSQMGQAFGGNSKGALAAHEAWGFTTIPKEEWTERQLEGYTLQSRVCYMVKLIPPIGAKPGASPSDSKPTETQPEALPPTEAASPAEPAASAESGSSPEPDDPAEPEAPAGAACSAEGAASAEPGSPAPQAPVET